MAGMLEPACAGQAPASGVSIATTSQGSNKQWQISPRALQGLLQRADLRALLTTRLHFTLHATIQVSSLQQLQHLQQDKASL